MYADYRYIRHMANLKLKRVYETAEGTDGTRFLVERLWPRGISRRVSSITSAPPLIESEKEH